jgi:hypothetical protein
MTSGLVAPLIISLTLFYFISLPSTLLLPFVSQLRAVFALDIYFNSTIYFKFPTWLD